MENLWENVHRTEFLLFLGLNMALNLALCCPYSSHIWKYLQWACEAKPMWSQWKLFQKVSKVQNFGLLWGPRWPKNCAFKAHNVYVSVISYNEHIKQEWCESRGNYLTKYSKTWILTHLKARNGPKVWAYGSIFYKPTKVALTSL